MELLCCCNRSHPTPRQADVFFHTKKKKLTRGASAAAPLQGHRPPSPAICRVKHSSPRSLLPAGETRDILGATSCCDRWHDVDSSRETGIGAQVAYELRVFRRETLPWINLLNRSSAPLSRSLIVSSNSSNCSSSHMTLLFWNVPETRDHLGDSIFFDRRQDVDSSNEMVISLASASSFTTLQSILSEAVLLLLNCFRAFLASRIRIFSPFDGQHHLLYTHPQLHEAFLHGIAEVKQDE
uniref:Uncharacterized protein n=1 Tax=Oryza meridionalis TaxID=40149 RepID=A0A0E0ENT2_9ORYZ